MVSKPTVKKRQKRHEGSTARTPIKTSAIERAVDLVIDIYKPALKELEKH
ncbi:MAG: hypothetical protein HYY03_04850 [Chloroflexi bacterium]|nr:hypothetical protein [Chloroflexota bacterium]